ncbi:MAG: helix-turn-helix domain-containing protein [Oscillospiraceae bacterium]|nr:helix-turn-helix domain-containing protein [Oscillospiraceae bacterium]
MKSKLKELRNKHGLSQGELAEAVGTTRRTIYSIESEDRDIHISLAYKLAAKLNCSIDDLFYGDGTAPTAADKAFWFVHIVRCTAEVLGKTIRDTTKLFERSGLGSRVIDGYDVWHTQGYEYMAEMLAEELIKFEE